MAVKTTDQIRLLLTIVAMISVAIAMGIAPGFWAWH